jgi:hypothetical protein
MLDPQIVMNLLPQLRVRVDLPMRIAIWGSTWLVPVCGSISETNPNLAK